MNAASLVLRSAGFAALIAGGTLLYEARRYAEPAPVSPPISSGRELVMVFLGSTSCAPSKQPGFNLVVRKIGEQLRARAYARGRRFERVGVALSGSPKEGEEFLSDFGPFEETITGRGWLNSGAISFVWREIPGTSAVPQLIVLDRSISVSPRGIEVSPDSLIIRVTGVDRIRSWSAAGTPID